MRPSYEFPTRLRFQDDPANATIKWPSSSERIACMALKRSGRTRDAWKRPTAFSTSVCSRARPEPSSPPHYCWLATGTSALTSAAPIGMPIVARSHLSDATNRAANVSCYRRFRLQAAHSTGLRRRRRHRSLRFRGSAGSQSESGDTAERQASATSSRIDLGASPWGGRGQCGI